MEDFREAAYAFNYSGCNETGHCRLSTSWSIGRSPAHVRETNDFLPFGCFTTPQNLYSTFDSGCHPR